LTTLDGNMKNDQLFEEKVNYTLAIIINTHSGPIYKKKLTF